MRRKNISRESYIKRLAELSDIKPDKKELSESKSDGVGELVNFKKDSNGINYGIIKENQKYYIKKGGRKQDPCASDFSYIGGLGNKTEYQYKTLAEADKNRNMILESISDSQAIKLDSKKNKMLLEQKEDVVNEKEEIVEEKEEIVEEKEEIVNEEDGDEKEEEVINTTPEEKIEKAEDALEDLEDKTEKEVESEKTPPVDDDEALDLDSLDLGDETPEEPVDDKPAEEPAEEPIDDKPSDEPIDDKPSDEPMEDPIDDDSDITVLQSKLGKFVQKIKETELETEQVKWFVNTFLGAFDDKFASLEIEEKKEMADKILKAGVDLDDEIKDIEDSVDSIEEEKEMCAECGSFTSFLESKGYTLESVLECGNDEMATNISEYANAYNEGMNDGDFENIGAYMNEEIEKSLSEEYGHDDFITSKNECGDKKIFESDEDRVSQIKEFWSKIDESWDTNQVETQPNIEDESDLNEVEKKEDDIPLPSDETPKEIGFAPDADILGADVVKPDGAPTTTTDINVDAQNKTVNIALNEDKLRKYIRQRLLEKRGLAKVKINESKKTPNLKKLDEMIDAEYEKSLSEVVGAGDASVLTQILAGFLPIAVAYAFMRLGDIGNIADKFSDYRPYRHKDAKEKEMYKESVKPGEKEKEVAKKLMNDNDIVSFVKDNITKLDKNDMIKGLADLVSKKISQGGSPESLNEEKLRKYIRNRLEEISGKKKPVLNEEKKSDKLKKLDKMIAEQFELAKKLHKGEVKKK